VPVSLARSTWEFVTLRTLTGLGESRYSDRMKRIPLIILTVFAASTAFFFIGRATQGVCVLRNPPAYRLIQDPTVLDRLIAELPDSPVLVDLRNRSDFNAGRINNFLNIPWDDGGKRFETWITPHRRSRPFIIICADGSRTAQAFRLMVSMGFTNITDFTPGFGLWLASRGEGYRMEDGLCPDGCPD